MKYSRRPSWDDERRPKYYVCVLDKGNDEWFCGTGLRQISGKLKLFFVAQPFSTLVLIQAKVEYST